MTSLRLLLHNLETPEPMPKSRHRSSSVSSAFYLRRRGQELAAPATRATSDPLAVWVLKKIRLDGIPFSFQGHEYLRGIFDDTASHIVLSKAAQIGGTTYAILRAIHACGVGLNVGYYFPTKTDVLEFSKSRVSPLLADNPFLARLMTETDTAGLKRIGEAYLYLRGMQSTVGMKSIPVDMLVFDELDEAPADAKALAKERLSHSNYRRILELSNPSLPDYGIDAQYQLSDQRHWTLRCPACGTWTALDKEFPEKMHQEVRIILPRPGGGFYRACPKCSAELDLDAGEWVADYPGRPVHGYRISQLFSDRVDPGEILHEYRTTRYPGRFFNMKIGIAWADLEHRLDVASVMALESDLLARPRDQMLYAMGVDTGKELHVVVMRKHWFNDTEPWEVVHLQKCYEFGELDGIMARFEINRCVIDGLPETHPTREFANRNRPHVYLNFFNERQRGKANWDKKGYKVEVNRTEALDMSRALIREKRVLLPRGNPLLDEFARHLCADAKVLEEDEETGSQRYRYARLGANHFSMAFTYAAMATSRIFVPFVV